MDRLIRNDKVTRRLTYLWMALSAYSAACLLGTWVPALDRLKLPVLMLSVMVTLGLLFTNLSLKGHERSRTANVVIALLLLWMAVMYFGSGEQVTWWVNYITQYDYASWTWCWVLLLPVVPLLRSYLRCIEVISYAGLLFSVVSLVRYTDNAFMQFLCEGFTLGAGLVVMTQRYHTKKLNAVCYAVLVVGLLTATIHARRNLMLTSACYLMVGGAQLMFGSTIKSKASRMMVVLTGVFVLLCGAGFYLANSRGMFKRITERAGDNTREYVYLHFAADLGTHPQDLVWGRSMKGTYECGGVEGEESNEGQRDVVECGYLNNMLKGGVIYLSLYMTLMLMAVTRGFKGRNTLAKACAWMLLFQLGDMVYFGIHSFNLKAYLVWMAVAIGLNQRLTQLTDDEMRDLIYEPKLELPKWRES